MTETIFFINPSEKHLFDNAGDRPPLGIMYLSSFLKSKGYVTKIWDFNHDEVEQMLVQASEMRVRYFCVSIATPLYKKVIGLAKKIRQAVPQSILIAGGNHVTDLPDEAETKQTFDYVIVGDGEIGLLNIVEGKISQKVVYGKPVDDLDSLPMPDYEGVNMARYTMLVDGKQGALLVTSRGCLFNCDYCGSAVSLNRLKMKKYRERSPQNVIEEMAVLYAKYGRRGFYFGDDIFTKNKQRVIEMCQLMREKFSDITWRATTRADLVDEEMLLTMTRAGCTILCIGIESGNDNILRKNQKGMTTEQNRRAVELCHKVGIKVKGFFIIGLSGETEETARETIEFAKSLRLEYADFYPLTPYPGTQLWNNPEKYGIEVVKPIGSEWDTYLQVAKGGEMFINIRHNNLSRERIIELVKQARDETKLCGLTYK